MKKSTYLFVVLMLFGVIFYPPIVSVNLIHPVAIIAWGWIILNSKKFLKALRNKKIFFVMFLIFLMLLDMLLVSFSHNTSIKGAIMDPFMWLFEVVPVCLMISLILIREHVDFHGLMRILLLVGNIQGVFSLISFVSPGFHRWVLGRLLHYGYNSSYSVMASYRLYGLSHSMTFFMPVLNSFLFVIALFMTLKNMKYIYYLPLLFFSAIINARTSMVVMGAGLLIIAIYELRYHILKITLRSFLLVGVGALILMVGLFFLYRNVLVDSNVFNKWIMVGFNAILALLGGEKTSYFSYLDSSRFQLPEGLDFIFGTGTTAIYGDVEGMQSDVGYINYIWIGGVIYFVMIFILFLKLTVPLIRSASILDSFVGWNIVAMIILINVKGYLFAINECTTVIILIGLFYVLGKRKESRDAKEGFNHSAVL